MVKSKKFLRYMLLLVMTCLPFIFSQPVFGEETVQSLNPSLTDFDKVAENENLALYVKPKSLAIKIVNKKNQYVWSSTVDDAQNHNLNKSWQKNIDSALNIEYLDANDKSKKENLLDGATVQLKKEKDGFKADIRFRSRFKMQLRVKLSSQGITIHIPQDSIKEPSKSRLLTVQVYQFLGNTELDKIPGYMFIPDGIGSLIDFKENGSNMKSPYNSDIYGSDLGVVDSRSTNDSSSDFKITMPVFGMVHGEKQNALFSIIEDGAEYANLLATKAGISTDFNWLTAVYHYRSSYQQPVRKKDAKGIVLYPKKINQFDITTHYNFLEGNQADYVGMAKFYQNYLVEKNMLADKLSEHPLLALDFLGGDMKDGLFWDTFIPATTANQLVTIQEKLNKNQIDNVMMNWEGWNKKGLIK